MLPRRQENFRWEKMVRKSCEVVIYLQLNKDPFTHTEDIITTAPSFTIIDENDNEDVNIED